MLVVLSQLCLKFGANVKEIGWLKKENIQVDLEIHQSTRRENSRQYILKIENIQQSKWKRNRTKLESMFVTKLLEIDLKKRDLYTKSRTNKQKKMKLKWSKEKQLQRVNNWMKVIFSDELKSVLPNRMMLKLLPDAIQMKHIKITAWRKQVNFPTMSWYVAACYLKTKRNGNYPH